MWVQGFRPSGKSCNTLGTSTPKAQCLEFPPQSTQEHSTQNDFSAQLISPAMPCQYLPTLSMPLSGSDFLTL